MKNTEKSTPKHYRYIDQFVDLANLLAPRVEWPTPDEIRQLGERVFGEDERWPDLERQRNAIIEPVWADAARRFEPKAGDKLDLFGDLDTLRGTVVVFRCPASDPARRLFPFSSPEFLYEAAYTVRVALRAISRAAIEKRRDAISLSLPATRMSAQIFPDGIIHAALDFYRDGLLSALDGFDARRLRECSVCGRLFIAKRHDKPACSPKCANLRRVRTFRKGHSAYHKRNERAARTRAFRLPRTEPVEFLWQQEA